MNPTQVHPALATNLGWNYESMIDTDKVTLVRRRIVYEELVMTKDEFEKMNNAIESGNFESGDGFYLNLLKMEDIGFPNFTNEETLYIAFPGDVTSCTDDAISFLFENKKWTDPYEKVKISS